MNTTHLILTSLAITRVTLLVTRDRITLEWRVWVWDRLDDKGWDKAKYLITCPWCASMYVAVPFVIGLLVGWLDNRVVLSGVMVLAGSYVVGFMTRFAAPDANPKYMGKEVRNG